MAAGEQSSLPLVSVIMNCLNGEKYLREAIDSVYAQTYGNWEIIFWDNASTDQSGEIARGYDGRLRYFRGEETIPLGAARNEALKRARGEFLAFLDCDDIWLPEKLAKQIPRFDEARVCLVFCDTYFFSDQGIIRQLYARRKPPRGQVFRHLLGDYFLSMETVVIRRRALDALSEWFDPRFNMIEETDLFLRLAHDGEFDYVDDPLAKWRVHAASWTFAKKHLFPLEREMLLEKFSQLYPGLETAYQSEVDKIKAKNQYQLGLLEWEQGQPTRVRQRLRPYLATQKRYLVPYFLSFLPYRLYNRLVEFRNRD